MGKKWNAVKRKLPFLSYHYFKKDWGAIPKEERAQLSLRSYMGHELRRFGHQIYAIVSVVAVGFYIIQGFSVKEWHPVSQVATGLARSRSANLEERMYSAMWNAVFGEGGLADINKDGLGSGEVLRAYEQMGYSLSSRTKPLFRQEGRSFVMGYPTRQELSSFIGEHDPENGLPKIWVLDFKQLKREYEYKLSLGLMGTKPGTIPGGND